MDDGTKEFSCSYGRLRVEYSVRQDKATVRFDLAGPSAADSYAQLWQDGEHLGTRNGTPLFESRDTEEGELNFNASYPYICDALVENAARIDEPTAKAIRRATGIDITDYLRGAA